MIDEIERPSVLNGDVSRHSDDGGAKANKRQEEDTDDGQLLLYRRV